MTQQQYGLQGGQRHQYGLQQYGLQGGQGQQYGGQVGGQPGQVVGQPGGPSGPRLQDIETPQQRGVADSVARAIAVCEHCANQCIGLGDANMADCIRRCEDVSELGETVLTLLPRGSQFAQPVLDTFEQAARACQQECSRHQHAHCQECAAVLGGTLTALQQLRGSMGGQPGIQAQYGQQLGGGPVGTQ